MVLCVLLLCGRCTKEKSFDPGDLPDLLHITGYIDPQRGVSVLVTKAVSATDTVFLKSLLINDAQVSLSQESGMKMSVGYVAEGKYVLPVSGLGRVEKGQKYRIEVSVPGLPTATSDWVIIPDTVRIDSFTYRLDGKMNGNSPTTEGYVRLKDDAPSGQTKYYYMQKTTEANGPVPLLNFESAYVCTDLSALRSYSFTNSCFIQDEGIFHLRGEARNATSATFFIGGASKEHRMYIESLLQPEEWDNALIHPKLTYTNIQGGLGVFYATHTVARKVRF